MLDILLRNILISWCWNLFPKYKGKRQNKLSDVRSYCNKKNHNADICFKRIREKKTKGDQPTCYNMLCTVPLIGECETR